jgi:hypothetical protein
MRFDEAREFFNYDPKSGDFFRIKKVSKYSNTIVGEKVKYVNTQGYIQFGFKGKTYKVHRTAWLLYYGESPKVIDHINGIKTDNRICNLRSVNLHINNQNRHKHRNGKIIGTSYRKEMNKWRSEIRLNGKRINLGHFNTEQEAHEAYKKEYKKHYGVDL